MGLANRVFAMMPEGATFRSLAWHYRLLEPELSRLEDLFPERIAAHSTAVDVGGWWGPWTYWLSRRAQRVVTFEPVPHLAGFLHRVVSSNVEVVETALSSSAGHARLAVPTSGLGSEGRSSVEVSRAVDGAEGIQVSTHRLDDFAIDDVAFLKIDVEGHEAAVLLGARNTIESWRPVLFVEVEDRGGDNVNSVFELMAEWEYEGYFLSHRRWRPIAEFDVSRDQFQWQNRVQRRGYIANSLTSRKYINNFAFRPHELLAWNGRRSSIGRGQ